MAVEKLWLCQLLTLLLVSPVRCVGKRTDDVSLDSLATLVQQLTARIEQLTASNQQLQATVQQLQAVDNQQAAAIQKLNTRVSFTAYMSRSPVNIGASNTPLVFDAIVTNIGGGYNPETGVFTCPVSGLYVFYAQNMNHEQHGWMQWGIFKSSTLLCLNHLQPTHYYDKSSCEATVYLHNGETVVVRRQDGNPQDQVIQGGPDVSFSGYLVNSD